VAEASGRACAIRRRAAKTVRGEAETGLMRGTRSLCQSCWLALGIGLGLAAPAWGAPPAAKPEVWMMPPASADGRALRELFTHPDDWRATRSRVDVLGYADHLLNQQFTEAELRQWLPRLTGWGLKLGLEVGAVKPWAVTGRKAFAAQTPAWDRFQTFGGKIYALALDEPLVCAREELKQPAAYAVRETVEFISAVRAKYPDLKIGDIEGYPSSSLADLTNWVGAVETGLKERGVRGLDFFRVDVDWCHFTIGGRLRPGNWPEVKDLEAFCRRQGIAFSLIYWAADYPRLKELGLADDATWYIGVMRQGNDYAFVGGAPDQYVIESWVGAPSRAVPEADEWTFTRSVRDFCTQFVPRGR